MFEAVPMAIGIFLLFIVTAIVCLGFLSLFLLVKDMRDRNSVPPHMQTDLTNMTILFNTMRDILAEQKDLARRFNASLDSKVGQIRDVMDSARGLAEQLDDTKRQVAELIAGFEGLEEAGTRAAETLPPRNERREARNVSPKTVIDEHEFSRNIEGASTDDDPSRLLDVVVGEQRSESQDVIDSWTGLDFSFESEGSPVEEEENIPTEPKDAQAARDAFRSLMNYESDTTETDLQGIEVVPANGAPALSPLESRVYEYSDAGMKVPEIARELGMGKGEVRLMLSLRKGKEA